MVLNKMEETSSKKKPQLYESYKKVKMLGEGTYGKAYLVSCESDGVRDEGS